jgi:putative two-component system response regulator
LEDRILIVDDEPTVSDILARRLAKEGYVCIKANNGKEALQYFYKDAFSLVISDMKMPEMSGLELLRKLKAVSPKITVIMITAFPEIDMAVEAMRLGAYDFLTKPVTLDLVVLSVRKALEKKRLEEEVELYHKNLELLVEERTSKLQYAYRVLKKSYLDSVKVLAEAIDAKDPYTRGHSDRVRKMSIKIATHLGFAEDQLENLEYGALLHDIGKIGIKDEILQKQGALTPEEYHYIQEHPLIGVKILEDVDYFRDKVRMIRHHHEHFDGSGYPDGLTGEAIPIEARIIAVPDAFDAMTIMRPHREAMSLEEVLSEMKRCRGKQFDPQVLDLFFRERIYKV